MARVEEPREIDLGRHRASILLVFAALAVIGIMQYGWFSRSAAVEVAEAAARVSAAASAALSREYQRYGPLLDELRSLRAKPRGSEPELASFLERALGAYGPGGITPGLLRAGALLDLRSPEPRLRCEVPGGTWEGAPASIARFLSDRSLEALGRGDIGLLGAEDGRRYFLAAASPDRRLVLALELDTEGFFERYAKPALEEAFPGAQLSWSEESGRAPLPGGGFPPEARDGAELLGERGFNPLRALAGGSQGVEFRLSLPLELLPFLSKGGAPRQGRPEPGSPPGEPAFRLLPLGAIGAPGSGRSRVLSIGLPSSSSLGDVERRLALDWCLGTLLLAALGLTCAQTIVQRRKLALVRLREREFVASVTHELRTPLTVIISAADNLRRGYVAGERVAEYGELIDGQSKRLGAMIEKVLLYSRVEGEGAAAAAAEPTGPERLRSALEAPLAELARGSGCLLDWDLSGLPPAFLGDEEGIELVLSNLVANAALHAYDKGSGGSIRVRGGTTEAGRIRLAVEDEGRGIPRQEASLVFEPFYRSGSARSRAERGSGLGLFLARRSARAMGGELLLESPYRRPGGARNPGCRFTLELPLKEADDVA